MNANSSLLLRNFATVSIAALMFASLVVSAAEREQPVKHLATQVFTVHTAQGDASVPMGISLDLNAIHREITRAAIVFHGKGRTVPGGAATILHLPLDPAKDLASLQIEVDLYGIVVGLLAATLARA